MRPTATSYVAGELFDNSLTAKHVLDVFRDLN